MDYVITSYSIHYTKLYEMVDFIMKGAPYFVFALMAGIVSEMAGDNPQKIRNNFV